MATEGLTHPLLGHSIAFKRNLGWSWTVVCIAELSQASQASCSPTYLACLMAPSRVLKRAPHSSTTQWKCTLWRKSHWASQKSLVPNLAKTDKQTSYGRPQERNGVGTDIFFLCFSILLAFPQTRIIPGNLDWESTHPLPWTGGYPTDGKDKASPMWQLQPGLQKYCTAPSLMYRTTTLPCKLQSKTHHIIQDMACVILEQMAKRTKPAQGGVTAHPLLRFSGLNKYSTNTCDFRKLQNHRESRKQVRNTGRKDLKLNKGILHN